jgi:tetratricopeptide (TPR) repeat protein
MSTPKPVATPLSTPRSAVLTPGLRRLLWFVLILFALLAVNSLYLAGITTAESLTGRTLQTPAYLAMFLGHLALGLLISVPILVFGALHLRRAWSRPNRWAVRAGVALYAAIVLVIVTGLLLTRFPGIEIDDPRVREPSYWIHVIAPLAAIWLFVLHRLAGPPLNWRSGLAWSGGVLALGAGAVGLHLATLSPQTGWVRAFEPSLSQEPKSGDIETARLDSDAVCAECHQDIAVRHRSSVHHLSSFNNPAYKVSIEETRRVLLKRDGNVTAARLCASCHDPVPLYSGRFDDPAYDPAKDPGSRSGITCMTCHAIDAVGSPRGNGDYRLSNPPAYPFEQSRNPILKTINRQLIRAKPELHKASLLKPMHKGAEFCSTCHKVALPEALNHYRWLRGQNHYDSFLTSGVSGHRVDSFYYPPQAKAACATCHMPLSPSEDPAARPIPGGGRAVHDHLFAAANTAVPAILGKGVPGQDSGNEARLDFLSKAARIDLFGIKEDGTIDGTLHAPLRPSVPTLEPGKRYLLEAVVRTTGMGHALTQGTVDSNELWLDVTMKDGDRVIGRSGGLDSDRDVDPWSWFLNVYLLDREGNRISRRNVQDIAVALYDHQIPPGAAAVVHYGFRVPADAKGPITVDAALRYRKLDTRFMRFLQGPSFVSNRLPVATLATDRVVLPLTGETSPGETDPGKAGSPDNGAAVKVADWERWNDYGIGLLREAGDTGKQGELRQAADAFVRVKSLGHADGPMNLARVLFREGDLDGAAVALGQAQSMSPPAPPWTRAWYSAQVKEQMGDLEGAIADLDNLAETRFAEARARGFEFAADYRMLTELGRTLYERAREERGEARKTARVGLLKRAESRLEQALSVDPEYAPAHYHLSLVLADLGDSQGAAQHRALHDLYRTDDNIAERAITQARTRDPAANHAAEVVAIYDLQRPGAFELAGPGASVGASPEQVSAVGP